MITHPALLGGLFVGLVLLVQAASRRPAWRWAFAVTPIPFWCYALPMLGSAAGWWPTRSPLYGWCSTQLLPVCLGLLLLGTDLRGLFRVGRQAVGLMVVGSAGMVVGMTAAMALWQEHLPPDAWQGLGALAGSWTGGSMNLLAVKEALGTSDAAIAPIIVTDTIVAYSWMALLLAMARPTSPLLRGGPPRDECSSPVEGHPRAGMPAWAIVLVAIVLSLGAQGIAGRLPTGPVVSAATWTVLLVTSVALALSLTPLGRWGRGEAVERVGMLCLLVLLASIGARADARAIRHAPAFLAAGATAVAIHAACLIAVGRWRRVPLGLLATVSQANIGGVVSAPLVAAAYDRALAPLGLLLAVFGNAAGTYLGLLTAAACRLIQRG